jgi:hypothetical protein
VNRLSSTLERQIVRIGRLLSDHERPVGLFSFNLEERTHTELAAKGSLQLPSPFVEGWITSLVDVSADASELFLTVGLMGPETSGGFRMVNHQLARMDLTTGVLHFVSHLKGILFTEVR